MINVVSNDKPKMLSGLDQKVSGQVLGVVDPLAQMLHHRRRAATFPTLGTSVERGKPVVLPTSYAKEGGKHFARSAHGAAGKGSGRKRTPLCNGVDRSQRALPRKRADFQRVMGNERTGKTVKGGNSK